MDDSAEPVAGLQVPFRFELIVQLRCPGTLQRRGECGESSAALLLDSSEPTFEFLDAVRRQPADSQQGNGISRAPQRPVVLGALKTVLLAAVIGLGPRELAGFVFLLIDLNGRLVQPAS